MFQLVKKYFYQNEAKLTNHRMQFEEMTRTDGCAGSALYRCTNKVCGEKPKVSKFFLIWQHCFPIHKFSLCLTIKETFRNFRCEPATSEEKSSRSKQERRKHKNFVKFIFRNFSSILKLVGVISDIIAQNGKSLTKVALIVPCIRSVLRYYIRTILENT